MTLPASSQVHLLHPGEGPSQERRRGSQAEKQALGKWIWGLRSHGAVFQNMGPWQCAGLQFFCPNFESTVSIPCRECTQMRVIVNLNAAFGDHLERLETRKGGCCPRAPNRGLRPVRGDLLEKIWGKVRSTWAR